MIEALKPGRILVLNTHSMEEADALGDAVAILANGRLRAYGTPLFLKNAYGAGYQINLITAPDKVRSLAFDRGGGGGSPKASARRSMGIWAVLSPRS